MVETIEQLWKEANAKRNGEKSDIPWYVGEGTSGGRFLWTVKDNVHCYIYISRNGKYSRPTFTLLTKKCPYGTAEVSYQEALRLAKESEE